MKGILVAGAAAFAAGTPAYAVGACEKPVAVSIPPDAPDMSLNQFRQVRQEGDRFLSQARDYLTCLNEIIYSSAPEDPLVSKAGKAHEEYAAEWAPVWGELNLACRNWEAAHGSQFPGGCQPMNPAEG